MATKPFELLRSELEARLDEMVEVTIADLSSEFLYLPKGPGFIEYCEFQDAYQVLKRCTGGFANLTDATVRQALRENSRAFGVLRAIMGMTPPEWAELACARADSDVTQNAARALDRRCRADTGYYERLASSRATRTLQRANDMVSAAVTAITGGASAVGGAFVHRLDQFDTVRGLETLRYVAEAGVPHAALLYERYLGRPFAGHRDAVSELVGEAIENAVEDILRQSGVSFRRTGRAERLPGFDQAPDFCIPDEWAPAAIIEAKIASDDGTARDKVARLKVLAAQRDHHVAEGRPSYEVIACIDGRGFRQRREDMRQLLTVLDGKVFTTATLHQLVASTRLAELATKAT